MDGRRQDPSSRGDAAPSLSTAQLLERLVQHAPRTSRYQPRGEIARGGMGAILRVWDEDLRRSLAMKVILDRGGAAGSSQASPAEQKLLARFFEEAQITGQLDHPGIVPVHELGLDAEGRVYFTMKLVKGRELEEVFELAFQGREDWNETRALGVLLKVCEAMAYAHQKNVIHRDLKPANVMVGSFGEVFVMDWGLARLLGEADTHDLRLQPPGSAFRLTTERHAERESATDSPLLTMDGDIVGTPAYMPPEQARGHVQQLSARSDVYSIGAMLYHLIARHTPYCLPGVKLTNHDILVQLLQDPPARLETLRKDIPPALVAICEKAMQREPKDRYADTRALADDLRSYLEGRVVKAYESGAWAEARQWVRRNRLLAASFTALLVLLVAGVASVAYVQAQGRKAALAELEARESMLEFLTSVIDAADPEASGLQAGWTLEEVVDRGTEKIQRDLHEFPHVRAQLLKSLARIQAKLGRPAEALKMSEEAVALARTSYGPDHPRTAEVERTFATDLVMVGRVEEALELYEHARSVAMAHPGESRLADWNYDLDVASSLVLLQRFDEALPILESLVVEPSSALNVANQERVVWLTTMGKTLEGLGRFEEAETRMREAVEVAREVWGSQHVSVARALQNLGAFHVDRGQVALALPELNEARDIRASLDAKPSIEDARLAHGLAVVFNKQGDVAKALVEFERALALSRRFAGESAQTARAGAGVGAMLFKLERYAEAEAQLREALDLSRRFIARKGLPAVEAPMWLARTRAKQGDAEEAAKLWTEVLACLEGDLSFPPPLTAKFENEFADVLEKLGRADEAQEHRERAEQIGASR